MEDTLLATPVAERTAAQKGLALVQQVGNQDLAPEVRDLRRRGPAVIDDLFLKGDFSLLPVLDRILPISDKTPDHLRAELSVRVDEQRQACIEGVSDPRQKALYELLAARLKVHLGAGDGADFERQAAAINQQLRQDAQSLRPPGIGDLDAIARAAQVVQAIRGAEGGRAEREILLAVRDALHRKGTDEVAGYVKDALEQSANLAIDGQSRLARELRQRLGFERRWGLAQLRRSEDSAATVWQALKPKVGVDNGSVFYQATPDERWQVELAFSLPGDEKFTFRQVGGRAWSTVGADVLAQLLAKGELNSFLAAAKVAAEREHDPGVREGLVKLDLARGNLALISVFPDRYDRVVATSFAPAALLEGALLGRYGRSALPPQLLITDAPVEPLKRALDLISTSSHKTKEVFIQLHAHGSPNSIMYQESLTAKDLLDLSGKFPNLDLYVMSIACYGGGMIAALKQHYDAHPEERPRVHFFAHTSPAVQAFLAPLQSATQREAGFLNHGWGTTPYFLNLIAELTSPAGSFGAAVDRADKASGRMTPINPESLFDGKRFGSSQLDPKHPRNPLRR
jgi:hypothetical protein